METKPMASNEAEQMCEALAELLHPDEDYLIIDVERKLRHRAETAELLRKAGLPELIRAGQKCRLVCVNREVAQEYDAALANFEREVKHGK